MPDLFLLIIIAATLTFDFVNGFHDAANAIATTISTRALSPRQAIALARTLNVVGALVSTRVATTVGQHIVDVPAERSSFPLLLALLIGAILWDLITWHYGLPSSSSHALLGGLIGAGVASLGWQSLQWPGIRSVLIAMVVSPVVGMLAGMLLLAAIYWLMRWLAVPPRPADRGFRILQVLSAGWMAFSHGMADGQKSMGIMTLALLAGGVIPEWYVPWYVKVAAAVFMGLGTAAGGWRIIRTLGYRVANLRPADGFAAETAAGGVLVFVSMLGIPLSTTHVITCTVMGTGAAKRLSAVRWPVVGRIIVAWVLTIPASALAAALSYGVLRLFV